VKRSLKQKNAADMFRRIFLFSNTALGAGDGTNGTS
jgi:hypothetical protein